MIGVCAAFFYFLGGIGPAIISCVFFIMALLIGSLIDGLANYSNAKLDFQNRTIESMSTFLGKKMKSSLIQDVNFNTLAFNTYKRNGGGFNKYVLEYFDGETNQVVYRVDHKEDRESILEALKAMHGNQ